MKCASPHGQFGDMAVGQHEVEESLGIGAFDIGWDTPILEKADQPLRQNLIIREDNDLSDAVFIEEIGRIILRNPVDHRDGEGLLSPSFAGDWA